MSNSAIICAGSQEEPLAEADGEAMGSWAPSGPHFCRHMGVDSQWSFLLFNFSSVHAKVTSMVGRTCTY